MTETKAESSTEQQCLKCHKHLAHCTCSGLQFGAAWPNLSNRARLEMESLSEREARDRIEMTNRFSQLKAEGSGTIFLSAAAVQQQQQRPNSINLAPGAIIGGAYKIIALIGRGGMGEVYLATHMTLGKKCALKVIPPDDVTEVGWQRFQLEAKTVSKMEHVNLVKVTDLGIHEECLPFYAMEYIDGQNLAEYLAEHGPMPLSKALDIFMQVCDGVDCAHRDGVLHRDLKPANIMLANSATGKIEVKILDFGLAKLTKHDRFKQSLTSSGDVFGSPCYMSPEQCGDEEMDSRSDIYSIGCTLFECLAGRPPFSGHLAAAVFFGHLEAEPPTLEKASGTTSFPPSIEAVMAKLLKKIPAERYQTLTEVKADLAHIAREISGSQPIAQDNFGSGGKPSSPSRGAVSRELMLQLLMAGVLIIITGLLVLQSMPQPDRFVKTNGSPAPGAAGSSSVASIAPPSAKPTSTAASLTTPATEHAAIQGENPAPAWHEIPFYQGVSNHEGKPFQHWQYLAQGLPPLYLIYSESGNLVEKPLLQEVWIPAQAKVCVMPKQALLEPSSLLEGLKNANFDELDYEWYSPAQVQLSADAFAACKSIRGLRIASYSWSQSDCLASVTTINKFDHLERLILGGPYSAAALKEIKRIGQLQELRLNFNRIDLTQCLPVISGSSNLQVFCATHWVPRANLAVLIKCQNLKKVMIGQMTGTHAQLSLLAQLTKLEDLELPGLHYRQDLANDLSKIKSLRRLRLLQGSDWTKEQFDQLKHDLPAIKITAYRDVAAEREAFWLPSN